MAIFGVYIINRAGGLIYQYDHNMPRVEVEKTYGFPLDLKLKTYDGKIVVSFGQKDGVKGDVIRQLFMLLLQRCHLLVFAVLAYARAVLGVVILSVSASVCLSVCHTRGL